MKYLKYLLIVMLILSFAIFSCKKDSTTGPTGGDIVGTWNVVDGVMGWLLTTNSNQVATNPFDESQTNIPANTPTLIQLPNDFSDEGIGFITIEFRNDGTGTVTDVWDGEIETENWTYTTSGNQLAINDEFNETMTFEYSISGNTMTWLVTDFEDYCGDFDSQTECFTETEEIFNLTPGSLTAASMQVEIIFNQAVAKQGLNAGRKYNLINPTKTIIDFKLRIEKLKESL